jgi:hypothetical protein
MHAWRFGRSLAGFEQLFTMHVDRLINGCVIKCVPGCRERGCTVWPSCGAGWKLLNWSLEAKSRRVATVAHKEEMKSIREEMKTLQDTNAVPIGVSNRRHPRDQ